LDASKRFDRGCPALRVSLGYRALGVPVDLGVQWFWIGNHADYDKLLA